MNTMGRRGCHSPALPPKGSPPLQSGGQNHRWPTSGQGGYITPLLQSVEQERARSIAMAAAGKTTFGVPMQALAR